MSTRTVPGFGAGQGPVGAQEDLAHVLRESRRWRRPRRTPRPPPRASSPRRAPFSSRAAGPCPGCGCRPSPGSPRPSGARTSTAHDAGADPADPRLPRRELQCHCRLPLALGFRSSRGNLRARLYRSPERYHNGPQSRKISVSWPRPAARSVASRPHKAACFREIRIQCNRKLPAFDIICHVHFLPNRLRRTWHPHGTPLLMRKGTGSPCARRIGESR